MGIDPGTNVMGYGVIRVVGNHVTMVSMGVIDMHTTKDPYLRLGHIFSRTIGLIESFLPDELAIESPYVGKNIASVLKLGRAQGVAIAAAISRDVPIHEYAPTKIKMALTGTGAAPKEQVAGMLQRILHLSPDEMPKYMDATDALAAAYCHYLQASNPVSDGKHFSSWKDFAQKNKSRLTQPTQRNNKKDPDAVG